MLRKQNLTPKARKHFGFSGDPFGPDPRCADDLHCEEDFTLALESAFMTARHGGMLAVIGESGCGKSTLRRALADRLKREARPVILIEPYVVAMDTDARGRILRADHIAEAILHAVSPGLAVPRSPEARFRALHRALRESARAGAGHCLIIEEAHDLHSKTVKHLKRFHELEDGFDRLLSVILFGQPELKNRLGENNPDLREVVQRLEVAELGPLRDVEGYVRRRLERAGAPAFERLFEDDALPALVARFGRGGGAPRPRAGAARVPEGRSTLYPLAVGNRLAAACNLAAELGFDRVSADIISRV